jgi:hypothetical protein
MGGPATSLFAQLSKATFYVSHSRLLPSLPESVAAEDTVPRES